MTTTNGYVAVRNREGFLRFENDGSPQGYAGDTLKPGWWYTGRCWLDEDEQHVWFAHDCTDSRVVTMLPWPTWQANKRSETRPSMACANCDFHASPGITDTLAQPTHSEDEATS